MYLIHTYFNRLINLAKSIFSVKGVSLIVVCLFASQQVALAVPSGSISATLSQALQTNLKIDSPLLQSDILQDPSAIQIPLQFTNVEEVYRGTNGKLIIHIQDAHTNYSGQIHLAKTLDDLMAKYGISLVLAEGGYGDASLSSIRNALPKNDMKMAAHRLLMDGMIAGQEYLDLTSNFDMKIIGVEDKDLYYQNLRAYQELVDMREKSLSYFHKIKTSINRLKNKLYPENLLDYEAIEDFNQKFDYLTLKTNPSKLELKDTLAAYPGLQKLNELKVNEATIDFKLANQEQSNLMKHLSSKGNKSQVKELQDILSKHKLSYIAQSLQIQKILDIAYDYDVPSNTTNELEKYKNYLQGFNQLDFSEVFNELDVFEHSFYKESLGVDKDKTILRAIDQFAELLNKAYKVQMSSQEYEVFLANEKLFDTAAWQAFLNKQLLDLDYYEEAIPYKEVISESKKVFKSFYGLVDQRDRAFLQNINKALDQEGEDVAFLVAGGYHTQNLTQLLKKEGYSYITLTPLITSETDHNKYEQLLLTELKSKNISDYSKSRIGEEYSPAPVNKDTLVQVLSRMSNIRIPDYAKKNAAQDVGQLAHIIAGIDTVIGKTSIEEAARMSKNSGKVQKLRLSISSSYPKIADALTSEQLEALLGLKNKELTNASIKRILGKVSVNGAQRRLIIDSVQKINQPKGSWFFSFKTLIVFATLLFTSPISISIYKHLTAPATIERIGPFADTNFASIKQNITSERSRHNRELTSYFLMKHPEQAAFLKIINSDSKVKFSNYVAEMVGNMLNSSKSNRDADSVLDSLEPMMVAGINATSGSVTSKIQKNIRDPRMKSLVGQVIQLTSLNEDSNVNELNEFDRLAVDSFALKSVNMAVFQIQMGRRRNVLSQLLTHYGYPRPKDSNEHLIYMDLASGTNMEQYLPDIIDYSPKRPIVLVDISPHIKRFWHTVSLNLGIDNIEVLDLDIRKLSRETFPRKVGTIRLQNVAAWVPNLSQEWANNLFNLVEPGGEIVFALPQAMMMEENRNNPVVMTDKQLIKDIYGRDKAHAELAGKIGPALINSGYNWEVFMGHVGETGEIVANRSGFISRTDGIIRNTVIVYQKSQNPLPAKRQGESRLSTLKVAKPVNDVINIDADNTSVNVQAAARMAPVAGWLKDRVSGIVSRSKAAIKIDSPRNTLIPYEPKSLSVEQFDTVVDMAYAIRVIRDKDILDEKTLSMIETHPGINHILYGIQDITILKGSFGKEEYYNLKNLALVINRMQNRFVDIIHLNDDTMLMIDRERLRHAATTNEGLKSYPDTYTQDEIDILEYELGVDFLIIQDMARSKGFFYDQVQKKVDVTQFEEALEVSQRIASGSQIRRKQPNPITDLAFPTARDAEMLEKSMRSHLDAMRMFGQELPQIWVFDDEVGQVADEKRKMVERLADEYGITINYVGDVEKELYLDQLLDTELIKQTGLSRKDLLDLYFAPRVLGSNRNYVHAYLSGKVYSTVDDDSYSWVSLPEELYRYGEFSKMEFAHASILKEMLRFGLKAMGGESVARVMESTLKDMSGTLQAFTDENESMKNAPDLARSSSTPQITRKPTNQNDDSNSAALLRSFYTTLFAFLQAGYSSENTVGQKAFYRTISSTVKGIVEDIAIIETDLSIDGKVQMMQASEHLKISQNQPVVVLPVNALGIHGRYITKDVIDLKARHFRDGEGLPFLGGEVKPGRIGFVTNTPNLFGPTSVGKDLDRFQSTGNWKPLNADWDDMQVMHGFFDGIYDQYNLSTATMTTIDNRASRGFIGASEFDSRQMAVMFQDNDPGFKLYDTAFALDHVPVKNRIRHGHIVEEGINPRLVIQKDLLMEAVNQALHIRMGRIGLEEATRAMLWRVFMGAQQMLDLIEGSLAFGDKDEATTKRLARGLVEETKNQLGFTSIPSTREIAKIHEVYRQSIKQRQLSQKAQDAKRKKQGKKPKKQAPLKIPSNIHSLLQKSDDGDIAARNEVANFIFKQFGGKERIQELINKEVDRLNRVHDNAEPIHETTKEMQIAQSLSHTKYGSRLSTGDDLLKRTSPQVATRSHSLLAEELLPQQGPLLPQLKHKLIQWLNRSRISNDSYAIGQSDGTYANVNIQFLGGVDGHQVVDAHDGTILTITSQDMPPRRFNTAENDTLPNTTNDADVWSIIDRLESQSDAVHDHLAKVAVDEAIDVVLGVTFYVSKNIPQTKQGLRAIDEYLEYRIRELRKKSESDGHIHYLIDMNGSNKELAQRAVEMAPDILMTAIPSQLKNAPRGYLGDAIEPHTADTQVNVYENRFGLKALPNMAPALSLIVKIARLQNLDNIPQEILIAWALLAQVDYIPSEIAKGIITGTITDRDVIQKYSIKTLSAELRLGEMIELFRIGSRMASIAA